MRKIQGLRVLLMISPLVLALIALDQITKIQAITHLCRLGPPDISAPCSTLKGPQLADTFYQSVDRIGTVLPIISLEFHLNPNAALSMPIPGPEWFEYILLLAIMTILASWLWREGGWHNAFGVGLILGGALGNFIDRLLHGAVVDFFALHFGTFNAFIFNLADAAITLGVVWLFIEQLILRPRRNAQAVVS